jgi:uncharacterized membrane protein YozB (DUF420 family)
MTQESSEPIPLAVVSPLSYASGETALGATTGTRVGLGIFAALLLIVSGPSVLWSLYALLRSAFELRMILVQAIVWATTVPMTFAGIYMLIRTPRAWKIAYWSLIGASVLPLLASGGAGFLLVQGKHATGWDALILVLGIFLAAAATALFWLTIGAALFLNRPQSRRAFGDINTDFSRKRNLLRAVMVLWIMVAVLDLVAYLVS